MIKVSVKERTQYLQTLLEQLKNPSTALDKIGKKFVESTQRRISTTKESPDGKPWAPWALATLLGRQRRGTTGTGLLYESGTLADSIKHQVQGKQVTVFSDAPYARFLQAGTSKMPARPFIGFSQNDMSSTEIILRRYLRGDK